MHLIHGISIVAGQSKKKKKGGRDKFDTPNKTFQM